jgi:arylsulfatase A-like enzyme
MSRTRVPRRSVFAATLGLVVGALLAAACTPETVPEPVGPPPNIVLVVADTLRADRVDGENRRPRLTPNLDALREDGAYFRNAHTTSSWTLPATVSIFVSQLPSWHGVSRWGSILGDELETLPELLRAGGYRTGGWSANRLITRERGFRQGFDEFRLLLNPNWKFGMPPESPHAFAAAADLATAAITWLDEVPAGESPTPFFIYLHFMEPHTPFLCPAESGVDCEKAARALNRRVISSKAWDFSENQQGLIDSFYDSDVRVMDDVLGQLRDALEERGLLSNTWILFTADHGEMLGEHGLYVHGQALFEETVQVPLLIRPPDGRALVIDAPVSVVDVAPTILAAARIPQPESFRGHSLLPVIEGESMAVRPIVTELLPVHGQPDQWQRHLVAVQQGSLKLVLGVDGEVLRFDLASDPDENSPRPAERSELEALLSEADVEIRHFEVEAGITPEITPEMREHLRGLGYLHE